MSTPPAGVERRSGKARRPARFGVLLCACSLMVSGCAFNRSPINTALSDDELDRRVRESFRAGMTGERVVARLRELDLPHHAGPIPPRDGSKEHDRGITARVRPPGLLWNGIKGPAYRSGSLYLWFDLHDRLELAAYEPPPPPWNAPGERRDIDRPMRFIRLEGADR